MDVETFLKRCDTYCVSRHPGLSRSRLSTIIFGSGVTLDRLHGGGGVTVRVLARADQRLADLECKLALSIDRGEPARVVAA